MVSDKRANKECNHISKLDSYKEIRKDRSDFEVKSSLMLPKILWLKNNKKSVFNEAAYFLSPNEYFGYRLTGHTAVNTFNAEKCFFDSAKNSYPTKLLKELNIPLEKLPKVVQVGDVVSQVTNEFKKLIHINDSQSLEYIVSTYDAICAFYG